MKKMLKSFMGLWIVLGVMLIIFFFCTTVREMTAREYDRDNDECTDDQRVFDDAGVLSKSEEEDLQELIEKRQEQTGLDIILVTIDEDLEEYCEDYEDILGTIYEDEYEMVYADNFYDEGMYGYDEPYGDGVLLLDNWHSEVIWLSGSGKAINMYPDDSDASWHLVDLVGDRVDANPYEAYRLYVNTVYYDYVGFVGFNAYIAPYYPVLLVLVITVFLVLIKLSNSNAKDTTTGGTYVSGGRPVMRNQADRFVQKFVTQRRIESSSGSGGRGGGSHRSAGGRSHGGGGGRH